jgi:F-type H+-transporting ATPase subunit b
MFLAETSIQLVPDGTLLLHLLMIGVMVAVLNRTLLKPINKILAEREDQITGKVNEARDLLKSSEAKLSQYHGALHEARSDGYQLLEKVRGEAIQEKDGKVKAVKEQINRDLAVQIEATHQQQAQVRTELESQAETLGTMISSQILNRR